MQRKGTGFVHGFVGAVEACKAVAQGYLPKSFAKVHQVRETRTASDIDSAEHEASEWIARLNADDVSSDDEARFEVWRKRDPRNAQAFDELSTTWGNLTARQADR